GGGGAVPPRRGGADSPVYIWDAAAGHVLHSLTTQPVRPGVECAFSPDGRWLLTAGGAGQLRLWEVTTGRDAHRFQGHRTQVTAEFSADGRLVVAASNDAPCFVWDVTGHAPDGRLRPETLSPARLKECRDALRGENAGKAYDALWA